MDNLSCLKCQNPLPSNHVCPTCGNVLFKNSNTGLGLFKNDKVRFYNAYVLLTNQSITIGVSAGIADMFGLVGVALSALQDHDGTLTCPFSEITSVQWPLKEKYGTLLNSVSGKNGILIVTQSGLRYLLRMVPKEAERYYQLICAAKKQESL